MENSYYTVLAWTVVLASGGVAYYYYNGKDGRQAQFRGRTARKDLSRAAAAVQPVSQSPRRTKKQQDRPRPAASRNNDSQTRAVGSRVVPGVNDEPEKKESMAWAHELAGKKQGTSLKPVAHSASTRPRTVKQTSANVRSEQLFADASTADEEDEPSLGVPLAPNGKEPSGRDVSDMLETTASRPAVLKLTESTNPKKDKPKTVKAAVQQESKRDRQNRKKAEEKKAQREADEKERRILEEKQRKTAREARGEPAKNGLGTVAAAPKSNAWKATNNTTPAPVNNTQLLDTFANDDTTTTISTAPTSVSSSPVQRIDKKWFEQSLPSEEEQRRILVEQDDDSWTAVKPKAKKGSKQNNGGVTPVEVV